jgi:hypothetical protein
MTFKSDLYLKKAEDLEAMAGKIADAGLKAGYFELAKVYRQLANQVATLNPTKAGKN